MLHVEPTVGGMDADFDKQQPSAYWQAPKWFIERRFPICCSTFVCSFCYYIFNLMHFLLNY